MNHLLLASLFFCIFQTTFSGNIGSSLESEQKREKKIDVKQNNTIEIFDFPALEERCKDVADQVILYAWSILDNRRDFEKELLEWENIDSLKPKPQTTYGEQNLYQFHGTKIPIYFYTLKNGMPTIETVGNILSLAQPTTLSGFSYAQSHIESTELFLHLSDNKVCRATLKNADWSQLEILSACLSVLGDIALIWKDHHAIHKTQYITLVKIKTIMENKDIDLTRGAQEIDPSKIEVLKGNVNNVDIIKGSIFTLDGSKLGICHMLDMQTYPIGPMGLINHMRQSPHGVTYLDINHDKPLTIAQKAKRLQIATLSAKKLIEESLKKKNQSKQ